jgi:hypothetical protein
MDCNVLRYFSDVLEERTASIVMAEEVLREYAICVWLFVPQNIYQPEMKSVRSWETSVNFYHTRRLHIPHLFHFSFYRCQETEVGKV